MFGYFEGYVRGNTAYVSWWEVTAYHLAGAVIPTSGAAALTYSFNPVASAAGNNTWDADVDGTTVTGPAWGAGATTLAGPIGAWNSVAGVANATLAANPAVSCLYAAPNQAGNNPTNPKAQYYWTPFWDTGNPASYRSSTTTVSFCSDAHTQPADLIFTSSAQSNYGAVLGSYVKRNAAGVDCGPGAPQAVACPTTGFDGLEVGYYGAGALPFAGAVSFGLIGTGQALTGPFAGRSNDGGSFSFLYIESVNASSVGVANPNNTVLSLRGFRCLLAGVAPGGDAYRISCAPELYSGRQRSSVTTCMMPYTLTPYTNALCAQSNARGRPLGYPAPAALAAAGFPQAVAAGTTGAGSGYIPSAGGVGHRRRRLTAEGARAREEALAEWLELDPRDVPR